MHKTMRMVPFVKEVFLHSELLQSTRISRRFFSKMYQALSVNGTDSSLVVDLRSDTMTRPSQAMREKMANAVVGDDVIQEDPTVIELEQRIAKILGKESAVFVSSGTQGNLIASLVHCDARGSEAIVGDRNHMFLYEQGTLAQYGGIQANIIPVESDGTFSLAGVRDRIRDHSNDHFPKTSLIAVENTQNYGGGLVLPLEWIDEVTAIGKEHGIPVHLDGARIFNASIASGVPASRIARDFTSISVCLSKGLGAPCGSLLVGNQDFVRKARRVRKALGGGMRQVGILAAAGLYCLDNMIERLSVDHKNAQTIATRVSSLNNPAINVDLKKVHTNMVLLQVNKKISASDVCNRFNSVTEEETSQIGNSVKVLAWPRCENKIRLVLHCDVSEEMARLAADKICYVAQEFSTKFTL